MAFVGRLILAVAVAFILFPIAFALWNGPDAKAGWLGGVIMMLFVQFISPFDLWRIPLAAGTAGAVGWEVFSRWRASRQIG